MVAIVNYGVGNLFSLQSSFAAVGCDAVIAADKETLARADRIVLPGVGAFEDAAKKLRASGLADAVIAEVNKGKPLLGICRGAQLINVALGGSLYQDIPSEYKTEIAHRQGEEKMEYSHSVTVLENTPLAALVGEGELPANSFHHQAAKRLGNGLLPMAYAADGIVEAMYFPAHTYLRAYQWHPERLCERDEKNKALFSEFITACITKI